MEEFNIFIMRHAESEQNAGIFNGIHDSQIPLTLKGVEQANRAGLFLYNTVTAQGIDIETSRGWVSPYVRTRHTGQIVQKYVGFPELRVNNRLREKEFGVFGWDPYENWREINPLFFDYYTRCQEAGAKAYAVLPLGESPLMVADRVDPFKGTMARDRKYRGIKTVFIFTHGVTERALTFEIMHYDIVWLEQSKNPGNCWIRQIKKVDGEYRDLGYIYQG